MSEETKQNDQQDAGDETKTPGVGTVVSYFSADSPEGADPMDRFEPRMAWVSEVRGDRFDCLVVASRSDSKAMLEPLRIERNCSFLRAREVIGNRRGDGGWDWSVTGQKFIAEAKPTVIPRDKAPKVIPPANAAQVPTPAPRVPVARPKAIITPPGFVPEPKPQVHPPIHATGRVKPKEGATMEV